jgi:G:T-mismatch repair DNA endonuclease (very short patch repair protein)
MGIPNSFIDETVDHWSKRLGRTFSREEARQAIVNTLGFFQVLAEWNCKTPNENTEAQALTSSRAVRRTPGGKRTR